MRYILVLALTLVASPAVLGATDVPVRAPAHAVAVQQVTLPHTGTVQVPVRAEEQRSAEAASAALQPTRMSWWWLVGAIVVGGIILSLLA
jgi:hypothetical protein